MRLAKQSLWGVTAAVAMVAIAGCGADAAALATVNGQAITNANWKQTTEALALLHGEAVPTETAAEKKDEVKQLMQWSAIEQWTVSHHVMSRAKARATGKTTLTDIEKEAGSVAKLKSDLKLYHLTLPEFSSFTVSQELLEAAYTKLVKSVPAPTSAAENAYYKSNASQFAVPATDEVRAILVKSKTTAETIEAEVKSDPSEFSALAEKDSTDKTSAKAGGELGSLGLTSANGLPTAFTAEMKALNAGEFGIADTSGGYYVMEVQKVNPASEQSFSSAKSTIVSILEENDDSTAFSKFGAKVLKTDKSVLNTKNIK